MCLHYIHQSRYHNRCKYWHRQIFDKSSCTYQYNCHCQSCCNGYNLCLSSILFIHGGSGNTSIYRTAAHCTGSKVSCCTGEDLLTVIQFISIFGCKVILRQKCLCHDHNSDHKCSSYYLCKINPCKIQENQPRKSRLDCLQKNYTILIHMKNQCRKDSGDHNNDCHWKPWD